MLPEVVVGAYHRYMARSFARSLPTLLFWLVCALASFAGCGGGDESGTASNAGAGGGKAGSGGSGASSGTGGSLELDGGQKELEITPPSAVLTITAKGQPTSQKFQAKLGGGVVAAKWTLSSYDTVTIDNSGTVTTTGIAGGKLKVTATYGTVTASADLEVAVKLSEEVDTGIDPANKAALGSAPSADPGAGQSPPNPTKFLYPYDQTVMPKGVLAPLVMVSPGSIPPVDAKVRLTGPSFSWEGLYKVQDPTKPRFTLPQDIWDAALLTTAGQKLGVEVIKASGGQAYGPYAIQIGVANGSLKGVVYYMTYEQPQIGLWAARPGNAGAAKQVKAGCVVCHSVSANGQMLSTGAEIGTLSAESGVYQVDLNGTASQITQSPAGLGGDSRGLSFGSWTPDAKYVVRSQNDFWGGVNQKAWKVDAAGKKLDEATVVGLGAGVSAYLPAFSHDGKRFAFTNGLGEPSGPGTPSRSISVMDVSVNESAGPAGTLTFTNRKVVLDNGATGKITKYATFLPDSNLIVLQESQDSYMPSYAGMLATYGSNQQYGGADGRLNLLDLTQNGHVELTRANQGNVAADENHNYEPFALPIPAGGYYWVVFTSIREYGNIHQGAEARKQLWVAAISPGAAAGADPSHPAFYLPNQTSTKNERGFWSLDICKPKGDSCQSGDECCDGFCRPSDPLDPSSPKICGEGSGCSQLSEKCSKDADCCNPGAKCLGGFCSPVAPQ